MRSVLDPVVPRIVVLGGEVTDVSANRVCAQLLLLSAEDPRADVGLYINSPGGPVHHSDAPAITANIRVVTAANAQRTRRPVADSVQAPPGSVFMIGQGCSSRIDRHGNERLRAA